MKNKIALGFLLTMMLCAFIMLFFSFRKLYDKPKDMKKRRGSIEYVVFHYTAAPNPNATSLDVAKFLYEKCGAGAHYVMGDEIIQTAPEDMRVNAVGGRVWANWVPKSWLKNKVTNDNSLSIEVCLKRGNFDYNNNLLRRVAWQFAWQLVNKGLDPSRVVRHSNVKGKYCPFFGCVYLSETEWDAYADKPDRSGYYNEKYEDSMWFRWHRYMTSVYYQKRFERGQIDKKQLDLLLKELGTVKDVWYGEGGIPPVKGSIPFKIKK